MSDAQGTKAEDPAQAPSEALPERAVALGYARQLLALRQMRRDMLGADLFADPAWDLLLHLYLETSAGRQVAISGLCAAAKVRPTTGLRWINLLVEAGLLAKTDDPADARRVFLSFAPGGEERMDRLLAQAVAEYMAAMA